jgi:predicted membrane-bound spermidine synthase
MVASMERGQANTTPMAGMSARVLALQSIFAVSGVCGLIYESIWSHYLKLFVGHAAYAQTVVLIVFIGGMALGAALVGRFAHRIRSPLLGYALAEAIIGVVSLLFHRLFVTSTDWAYATLLPAACVPESPCLAQWVFASLLILPQSVLLGTTFPLMTGGILRLAPVDPGRRIALLYFLNSIGAAVGVLLAGFWLIPALGLPGTLLTAGLMNIAVAFGAWACAKSTSLASVTASAAAAAAPADASFRRWLILVAALTGLSSFIYEIIWIRMLALVVGASTHAFELMLAAFIFGLAMGGLWVRKRIDRFRDLVFALAVVQVLMGVAAVATLALYDGMFDFMSWMLGVLQRTANGYVLYNLVNHALALAIMLPATFLAGMTFPLITTALLRGIDGERAIGYTYAANTFGSIVGVILAVHFALPVLGIKGGLIFGAAIDIALGVALLCLGAGSRGLARALQWGGAGAFVLLAVAIAVPVLPERMASGVYRTGRAKLEADRSVPFHADGKTASVTIVRGPGTTTIATNGKPDASIGLDPSRPTSDEVTMVMTGVLPLAFLPLSKNAAVIGFGSGMTTTTLLASPTIERVDTIEIEPQMVEAAKHFRPVVDAAYADPRSRIVIDDAKSYFARSKLRYDLIVSEPSNPWVSGVASLFTREFYTRVRNQLNPGGLFVQWVHVYEFNDQLLAAILRALDAEFRDYVVYAAHDGDFVIVAAPDALPSGPTGHFLQWPAAAPLLQRAGLPSVDELHLRRLASKRTIQPLLAVMGEGVNSDYYPIVDQSAPLARFVGHAADGLMRTVTAPIPLAELLGDASPAAASLNRVADAPLKRKYAELAADAISFVRTGKSSGNTALRLRDNGLLRAVVYECATLPAGTSMRDLILPLANVVNPMASRQDAVAMWEALGSAKCSSAIQGRDREWFDLFAAVAARDAPRMAELGVRLAKEEPEDDFRAYAVMAGGAGLIVADRLPEAARFLDAMSGRLSPAAQRDPPMRLLAVLARTGLPKHAEVASRSVP